jgi:cobalt-zinc-cadmium efflux system membrane fusion protein
LPALLILALASCASTPPERVQAEAKGAAAPPSGTQVVLEAAAQRDAGIAVTGVIRKAVPVTLRANGRITINENRTWRVGAVTDGRIVRIYVTEGAGVAENQVLARMHSHDVHESRAAYAKALAEVARLSSAETYARRIRDRASRLYELKAGSLEQLEHAEAELRNTLTALDQARVEVERTRTHLVEFLGVAAEEPEHHKEGGHGLDDHDLIPVRSPATGTLLHRGVTLGTVVQPSSELFVVTDLSTVWMMAAVSEEHLSRLRVGMPANVTVQAHASRSFPGRVARLSETLDPATRTIQARIDLPNPRALLKPEMYATAEIVLHGSHDAIFVPETAIQELKGHAAVFVRKSATLFEARPIETGASSGGVVEVSSGLDAGDQVVTRGGFLLKSQLLKSSLTEEE